MKTVDKQLSSDGGGLRNRSWFALNIYIFLVVIASAVKGSRGALQYTRDPNKTFGNQLRDDYENIGSKQILQLTYTYEALRTFTTDGKQKLRILLPFGDSRSSDFSVVIRAVKR